MFNNKIKKLEALKRKKEIEIMLMHDTPADPMIAEMSKSDLLVEIMIIDSDITFEKRMKPFKYMILGFIIVVAIRIIFMFI